MNRTVRRESALQTGPLPLVSSATAELLQVLDPETATQVDATSLYQKITSVPRTDRGLVLTAAVDHLASVFKGGRPVNGMGVISVMAQMEADISAGRLRGWKQTFNAANQRALDHGLNLH